MNEEPQMLWEILVPTKIDNRPVRTRQHRVWDKKVRDIANGLTIFHPVKGYWVSPDGELFVERMIPVRIKCTEKQINLISDFTSKFYNQKAIMFGVVSERVFIIHYDQNGKRS